VPEISRRKGWVRATVERIPNGQRCLADVNVATLAGRKRTPAANGPCVYALRYGRDGVYPF
jgi:hypothetical protein